MSTAVFIVGQARTFNKCWRTQYWHLYRHLQNPTFYVCVENDEQAQDMNLIQERYPKERIHVKLLPLSSEVTDLPKPSDEHEWHAPYPVVTPAASILKCFWNYNEAWKFYQSFGTDDDLIVRCRPDAFFHSCEVPKAKLAPHDFMSLWWERYGGVNDRLVFMGPRAAESAMTMITRIDSILAAGCPLHGESVPWAAVQLAGMRVRHELCAWLSLLRLNGDLVLPVHLINEKHP